MKSFIYKLDYSSSFIYKLVMQMQMHTQLLAIEPRAGTSGFRSDEDEWLSAGSHLDPKPSNNSFQVQGSQQDPLLL
jgi:hypothetical protein